jgi:hypothetical protein
VSPDEVDDQLTQMAGSRKLAHELRQNLEKLRSGTAGPGLAQMARDMLDGPITLREVTHSATYAGPLARAMNDYQRWHAGLSDNERAELIERARWRYRDDED